MATVPLVLRQLIRSLERRVGKPVRLSRVEKLLLALVTVLKWHRELVKRKWTFQRRTKVGRLRLDEELEALIVCLAHENPGMLAD